MANKRHPDQKLIAFAADRQLRAAIKTCADRDGRDQSTFIRQALIEKLQRLKIPIDPRLAFAPDRSKPDAPPAIMLNDASSASPVATEFEQQVDAALSSYSRRPAATKSRAKKARPKSIIVPPPADPPVAP